jgi:methyl-accepting chemotaxis protein
MTEPPPTPNRTLGFISLRTRLMVVFTLLFTLVLAGIFLWIYRFTENVAVDNLKRDVGTAALTTALGISGDEHEKLVKNGKIDDPIYEKISSYLRTVRRTNPKASGLYTYIQDPKEPTKVKLIVSSSVAPGKSFGVADEMVRNLAPPSCKLSQDNRPKLGEEYDPVGSRMINGLSDATVDDGTFKDNWGTWQSGYAPIRNSKGAIVAAVGIDMCAAVIDQVHDEVRKTVLYVFIIVISILVLAVYLIALNITRPLLGLAKAAENIGRGEYDQNLQHIHDTRVQDEVSALALIIENMSLQVKGREETLKEQVQELMIEIDEAKRQKQVEDIVESDFFRELKDKAARMRERSRKTEPLE